MANTLKFGNGEWYGKKDTILAYNDLNSNYKPLPFNFSRASKATVINKDGLIETVSSGEPRIDYKDDSKGALLLEPSRTNLVTYSEDFSQWNKSNVAITITSNYGLSPNGLNNSSRIQFTGASQHINISTSLGVGVTSTGSVYIKGTLGEIIRFDTGGVGGLITLTGDWQRIEVTSTSVSSLLLINTFGGATARDIQVFGAQCEEASYATSYIPTQGSTVTRLADSCSNDANQQVINSTEGVLYFEGSSIANDGTFKRIGIGTSDNSFANSIQLRYNAVSNSITYQFRVGNVYQADLTITANTTNVNKIACVWKINRFEIWVNGVKEAQHISGSVPSANTFNSLFFGKVYTSLNEPFKGNVKDVRVYNTALTDQELQALTQV